MELANTIEGLALVREMDEYFEYNDVRMALTGMRSGRVFTLGDTVSVTVARVDIGARQIDLSIKRDSGNFKNKKKKKHKASDLDPDEYGWDDY